MKGKWWHKLDDGRTREAHPLANKDELGRLLAVAAAIILGAVTLLPQRLPEPAAVAARAYILSPRSIDEDKLTALRFIVGSYFCPETTPDAP